MTGAQLQNLNYEDKKIEHIAVKEAVFPFKRFPGVDTILGPEMRSTGEVMGIDREFGIAFAKSQIAGGTDVPCEGVVFVSVKDGDKEKNYSNFTFYMIESYQHPFRHFLWLLYQKQQRWPRKQLYNMVYCFLGKIFLLILNP